MSKTSDALENWKGLIVVARLCIIIVESPGTMKVSLAESWSGIRIVDASRVRLARGPAVSDEAPPGKPVVPCF